MHGKRISCGMHTKQRQHKANKDSSVQWGKTGGHVCCMCFVVGQLDRNFCSSQNIICHNATFLWSKHGSRHIHLGHAHKSKMTFSKLRSDDLNTYIKAEYKQLFTLSVQLGLYKKRTYSEMDLSAVPG